MVWEGLLFRCLVLLVCPVMAGAEEALSVSERLSRPGYADFGKSEGLGPVTEGELGLEVWEERGREEVRGRWEKLLGKPSFSEEYGKGAREVAAFDGPGFRGTVWEQPTGPGTRQQVLVMEPLGGGERRPGAVVPYYRPDAMAGFDLKKRERVAGGERVRFGWHLVQQGYVVVCPEAFPYNMVPEEAWGSGLETWQQGAERLLKENPGWSGMGKLVYDTRRALDLLLEQPEVDGERIVVMGHSLGGKMAFYAGCLDDRVKATVASDFGIGWEFTNWKDPWYHGGKILEEGFALGHHELLALHAPRAFLLIAGEYDKRESWQYLQAAKPVYGLYGREGALGMLDHASGHEPTEESLRLTYRWLAEQFGLEAREWEP